MEPRKLYVVMVLVLGSGLLTLVVAALPVVSSQSVSQALPLDDEVNPCGYAFQIDIVPHLPTQHDTITVTYSAVWDYLPTPMHQSHEIADHVIRLDAVYYSPAVGLPVMWSWGGKADVGNLPTGTYTVEVYLTTVVTPTVFPPELCGTRSFAVYEETPKTYLPVVAR